MDRPARLRTLLAQVVSVGDPEERLRALAQLRRELEAAETELAANALRAGLSWSQIGASLGVSKQTAHRRHSHDVAKLDEAAEAEHQGSRVLVRAEARRAVRVARQEAVARGEPTVGTEHLLLGLLQCGDPTTVELLDRLGVTLTLAREAVQPTVEASLRSARPGAAERSDATAVLSPFARRVIEEALAERAGQGSGALSALDLLRALLRDDAGGAARTLEALGVGAPRVRIEISRSESLRDTSTL